VTVHDVQRHFDLDAIPLEGRQVIEASAGTGKTRTITGLVLRLVVEKGVPIDAILVVTYTVAATEELRERIRTLLLAALDAFRDGACADETIAALLARVPDRAEAERRVRRALTDFDLAGILTIHGFCRRALVETAFESGMPFDAELVPDVGELLQDAVDDFWRRRVTNESALFVQHLLDRKVTPDTLAAAAARYLGRPDLRVVLADASPDDAGSEEACLEAWGRLRDAWPGARADVESLLGDPGLNRTAYKAASVPTWLRRMDAYLRTEQPGLRPFDQLRKFGAVTLAGAWKKGATPRTHPAFDIVETFAAALHRTCEGFKRRLPRLKAALLVEVRTALEERKRDARLQSFDDLLLELRRALRGPHGRGLAARLRARWQAVLVDEFQDTDPAQYDIVRAIWGAGERPVFLVGDPKQAIYRFRGADVYAYLAARTDADARHDLIRNWRSEPRLIAATNALFSRAGKPFVLDDIPFLPVEAARTGELLSVEGERPEPFRMWFLERAADDNKVIAKGLAARRVAESTAAEIARLLQLAADGKTRVPDPPRPPRPLAGGDIAVLVRSHHQGRLVADALARRGVPSVQQAADSVFASPEAEQLRRVLLAVADPGRDEVVRAALGTELLDVSGERLVALLDDDRAWADRLEAFHRYHLAWREHGFGRMFRELLATEGVSPRLLEYADGERRLTNLLHLGELLQEEVARHPRGLDALVQWIAERAADEHPEGEEQQLRLESDENVVKIVTVHKSKGLEYPVVFCPFVWDGRLFAADAFRERDVVCHDPTAKDQATLELEAEGASALRAQACREELAEQLRLFYVAVTRAIHRCTIVWGLTGDSHTAAPFWLLHASQGSDTVTALTAERKKHVTDATLWPDLTALAERSGGTIHVEPLPAAGASVRRAAPDDPGLLAARPLVRRVERAWRMASFTALTGDRADEGPDHDAAAPVPAPEDEGGLAHTIFTFPRGVRAGTCLHAILEHVDFAEPDPAHRREVAAHELARAGFGAEWLPVIEGMLERVLATALDTAGRVRLLGVPRARRLDELEFTYPLVGFDLAGLGRVLGAHGFGDGPFAASLAGLKFGNVTGFMRGFIDLVFEADGRYWLVDYKSNWLGPTLDDYRAERLPPAIARAAYWLQYLIYTVVLHRLLRCRLPGYDYDAYVGGVFYLFLRGMTPELGAAAGVFHDRPSRALVDALDRWIGGER
jgi:exodeoxyribonuclease V beta subunit